MHWYEELYCSQWLIGKKLVYRRGKEVNGGIYILTMSKYGWPLNNMVRNTQTILNADFSIVFKYYSIALFAVGWNTEFI